MIFNENGFQGVMSKFGNKKKKDSDTPVAQVSIKHTASHPDFFSDVNDVFKTENISKYSDMPAKFKVALSLNLKVNVQFEDMSFNAKLIEVVMAKKETKDDIVFVYEMKFEKEIDNEDPILSTAFLNKKEKNDKDKDVLVLHSVLIKKAEDK